MYNIGQIITAISISLEGVWIPWFTKKIADKEYLLLREAAKVYVGILSIFTVCIMLISPEIVRLLAPNEYWNGVILMPALLLSNFSIFLYSLYADVEYFYKKTMAISVNSLIAAINNIVLNMIFIPKYGYIAAGWTTMASYLISLLLHTLYAIRLDEKLYKLKDFWFSLLMVVLSALLFIVLIDLLMIRIILIFSIAIILCISEIHRPLVLIKDVGKH